MVFSERRKVFNEMDAVVKGLSGTKQHNFASIVPEYLFYSNLGRIDLIRFESRLESFRVKNGISEKDLNPEMPKQKQE